jgi:alpha-ketoglutarate-dependent taurine dioxygenase
MSRSWLLAHREAIAEQCYGKRGMTRTLLPPVQVGRSAWRGVEMAEQGEWTFHLTPEHIAELEAAARPLVAPRVAPPVAGGNDVTRTLPHLTKATFPLRTLAPILAGLLEELLHGRGFVLLRGLPIARYSRLEAATLFMGLGAHLGKARSQNARGHVLGHVYDVGLSSADPNVRIYQTRERQTFHTDSCDVVGLLCVREARKGGESLLVSALTLFNELRSSRPDLLARLLEPMPHDRRGEVPEGAKPYFEIPVFSAYRELLTVFYQRQYFDSAQRFPEARRLSTLDVAALDAFDALANDDRLYLKMRLLPGDIQFVHNHTLLHDRTSFEDDPDHKRHLLRLWLSAPGARPLPPAFAARYGSLDVGDRGGIAVPGAELHVPLDPE